MSAYSISLINPIFHSNLEITKEGGAIFIISSFKTCAHKVPLPTVLLWRFICSLNWYLFRKGKNFQNHNFCTYSVLHFLQHKGRKAHGWHMSESGFDWDTIKWQSKVILSYKGEKKNQEKEREDWETPVPNLKKTPKPAVFFSSWTDTENRFRPPVFPSYDQFSLFFYSKLQKSFSVSAQTCFWLYVKISQLFSVHNSIHSLVIVYSFTIFHKTL